MANYDLPGKTILTHCPLGIRVELNFGARGELTLWISPNPEDPDARARNFSNRDDHTCLFDRITLPRLTESEFVSCDWDPFHVVVHFKSQTVHLVPLMDAPAVVLWFEGGQAVDFKSDKEDSILDCSPVLFAMTHPDRGYRFEFVARLGKGKGAFRHQVEQDDGRSTYARAEVAGGQTLIIGGGLRGDGILDTTKRLATKTPEALLDENEKEVERQLEAGRFTLRGNPELQKLLDLNRRLLLAKQDPGGAIRAALNRIYYMIWTRDGSIIEAMFAYSGFQQGIERWADFLHANPYKIQDGELKGRETYVMLVNPISKWEEDGVFYAIWSTFTAWTQSGNDEFLAKDRQSILREAMRWLEDYIFNPAVGLFGRYFACESPFSGSRDDGFDAAVGVPTNFAGREIDGVRVKRAYDLYINQYAYASYVMLAAMNPGRMGKEYLEKASALRKAMEKLFEGELPSYGLIELHNGKQVLAEPYGLDLTDYVWACSIPPFSAKPDDAERVRRALLSDAPSRYPDYFLAGFFSLLRSIDTYHGGEEAVMQAVEYAAKQCYRAGQFLPMPYTVIEMLDKPDGHGSHDVRPQAFSIGPFLATITGLGLRRLPFGLAVRNTRVLEAIHGYAYHGRALNVEFSGEGTPEEAALYISGHRVHHTLQIPENRLQGSTPKVKVVRAEKRDALMLIESTVRLFNVNPADGAISYLVRAYGLNRMSFRAPESATVTVHDEEGNVVECKVHRSQGMLIAEFEGAAPFLVVVR